MDDINNYVFSKDSCLGKGSFSKVYLGKNIINDENVAIKLIDIPKCNNFVDINKEINILRELNHENIVQFEDSILKDNKLYIVLEYCPLGDLNKFFNKVAIKEQYVKHYARQIIDGLMYLSSKNIMHRDIKPHNILLKNIYTIKLTDFGFAKYYNNVDMTNTLCGSPIYMAPEIMKLKNYDYKADIWSLGVVLYELLYSAHPFTARNHFELVKVIEKNEVQFLDYPVLTDQCKQFISILLHKNPTKRASFHDIIDHVWLNNWNTFNILTSSSTYELYNEFIVQDRSKDINTVSTDSMSNNSMTSLLSSSNEEIFKFDDEDNFKSIDLSDHGDYVMVEDNVKTIAMTYSLHDLYQKFIDNYF
jgi:serine/threonine-protein kinase ULK/ATG1